MPAELFRTVVSRRPPVGRRLGAVPLSIIAHAVILAVAVVVPLIANDTLPKPWVPLSLRLAAMPAVVAPQAPALPRASRLRIPTAPAAPTVPLEAPRGIAPPTGLAVAPPPEFRADAPNDNPSGFIPGSSIDTVTRDKDEPPPAKPAGPIRITTGGKIQPPVRVHYQPPTYPQIAVISRVQGTVTIEAIISATGAVQDAHVVSSVPLLDEAALAAVRQWAYVPTRLNGVPVPVIMTVKVEFKLQ